MPKAQKAGRSCSSTAPESGPRSSVERAALERSGYEFIYGPDERIPSIVLFGLVPGGVACFDRIDQVLVMDHAARLSGGLQVLHADDATHPGSEIPLGVERVELPVRRYERVLGKLLGTFGGPAQRAGKPEHPPVVFPHEYLECLAVNRPLW